jgi:hypothetical protein
MLVMRPAVALTLSTAVIVGCSRDAELAPTSQAAVASTTTTATRSNASGDEGARILPKREVETPLAQPAERMAWSGLTEAQLA